MSVLLALLAMFCWGLAPLFGKLGLVKINSITALSIRTIFAACMIISWNLVFGHGLERYLAVPARNLIFIILEALLATLIGDLAYFMALKQGNINQVTLIMSSAPLITIVSSYLFLGERTDLPQLAGALLIIAGLALVGLEPKM
ncbi:MAG: EamA family transporter [Firmicutes bacterium]|nr:EamA family transporter [Bacillota bacterium]